MISWSIGEFSRSVKGAVVEELYARFWPCPCILSERGGPHRPREL